MNTFFLKRCENGDIYFDNLSCMYPAIFEKEINRMAGEQITAPAPSLGGLFGNFVNTFIVKKEKESIFWNLVYPQLGSRIEKNQYCVWNKKEEAEANSI